MGHINFDKSMNQDRKGLVEMEAVGKDTSVVESWVVYKVPLTY